MASKPLFSTPKRIERSYHSAVGEHSVVTWSEYSIAEVKWPSGKTTSHLQRTDYVNGQPQWSGASYGAEDTKWMLADMNQIG